MRGLLLLIPFALLPAQQPSVTIALGAGAYDRHGTPAVFELPRELRNSQTFELMRLDTRQLVDVQRIRGTNQVAWIIDDVLRAARSRRYRLSVSDGDDRLHDVTLHNERGQIAIRVGSKPVLIYNMAVQEPPAGIDPIYRRSGYIYPLFDPAGRKVTDDFAPDHAHQHSLFYAWVNTSLEGRKIDFWNQHNKTGDVTHASLGSVDSGDVFAQFEVKLDHWDKTGDRPLKVIAEEWRVRVYDLDDYFIFDLESQQVNVTTSPLIIHEYRYGGMGTRGAREWFESSDSGFLTSEGKGTIEGNHTRPVWVENFGKIEGEASGFTVMGRPGNFRFPQPVRLHPTKPYFVFAPMVVGEFELKPGRPYQTKYRFYVHMGAPSPAVSERIWKDYSEPPTVTVVEGR